MCRKVHRFSLDRCSWCGRDERQSRYHHFVSCEGENRSSGKTLGNAADGNTRDPRMSLLFNDERATKAVRSFLREIKMGKMVTILL